MPEWPSDIAEAHLNHWDVSSDLRILESRSFMSDEVVDCGGLIIFHIFFTLILLKDLIALSEGRDQVWVPCDVYKGDCQHDIDEFVKCFDRC